MRLDEQLSQVIPARQRVQGLWLFSIYSGMRNANRTYLVWLDCCIWFVTQKGASLIDFRLSRASMNTKILLSERDRFRKLAISYEFDIFLSSDLKLEPILSV